MPIYEYECEQCHGLFERKQRYDEEPVAMCQCGGRSRRVLRSVPIIFKGSGFYVTDIKKSNAIGAGDDGAKAKPDKPKEAVAADAKSSTAAEAKPTTPATKPSESKASS